MGQTVAVFGLGSMGMGMARSLLAEGHTVYGFDVAPERVSDLAAHGGLQGTAAKAATAVHAVVIVVLNAAQCESVLFGPDGIVPRLAQGAVVLACPTVPPAFAREMAERCADHGVHYLDAPISGGAAKAATGDLSVMASGTPAAFEAAAQVLQATAETVFELGDQAGAGSAMKAVNQLLAGTHIASMAEALTFGIKQGISAEQIVEVIPQCAGTSWMFENRAPHVVDGDYTPRSSINIWPKDLGIVLDIARASDTPTPLAATALQQFVAAAANGLGGEDDAAVTKIYAHNANVDLPSGSS